MESEKMRDLMKEWRAALKAAQFQDPMKEFREARVYPTGSGA